MARNRRSAKRQGPHRPLGMPLAQQRIEVGADGHDYAVRQVAAARATKVYRCPGCDQEIRPGVAHVVVWPADLGEDAIADRRHWHTACWGKRASRGPTRKWS
ncbi:hypothetical protein [Mycolicibacterium sp.]|uniref:hypothetical protein n=1 Tax=Mycolicibacterium sp. TaxID=2320850 RepID=UPI00355E96B8